MEKLIHAIIRADKQAQQQLDEAEAKRRHIRKDVQDQKKSVEERYMKDAKLRIDEHKAELEKKLEQAKEKKTAEYEETLHRLQESFHTSKDSWIHEIVKRAQES